MKSIPVVLSVVFMIINLPALAAERVGQQCYDAAGRTYLSFKECPEDSEENRLRHKETLMAERVAQEQQNAIGEIRARKEASLKESAKVIHNIKKRFAAKLKGIDLLEISAMPTSDRGRLQVIFVTKNTSRDDLVRFDGAKLPATCVVYSAFWDYSSGSYKRDAKLAEKSHNVTKSMQSVYIPMQAVSKDMMVYCSLKVPSDDGERTLLAETSASW